MSTELPKLWQFMRLHAIDIGDMPAVIPNSRDGDGLYGLLVATVNRLPRTNRRLAAEILLAIGLRTNL